MGKGPGSEIAHAIKNSLDGMPIHVRQLAEMFRKHGNAHKRNDNTISDMDRVPEALRDGWDTNGPTPNHIVDAGKGNRPNPTTYLDPDYIDEHLGQFANGATRIYRTDSIQNWGLGNNQVPGNASNTAYVFPTDRLREVMDQAKSPQELAETLGLPRDFFDGADVQLRDFKPEDLAGLRMPSGNEGGTDVDHWIPGGYLPSGIPEAVIDIPDNATGWKNGDGVLDQSRWPGSWREFKI